MHAYKDLPPPARELLDYYQTYQDVHIKYEQVIAQFVPAGIYPPEFVSSGPAVADETLTGEISVHALTLAEGETSIVEDVSFAVGLDEHVAIVGMDERAVALAPTLIRLARPEQAASASAAGDWRTCRML